MRRTLALLALTLSMLPNPAWAWWNEDWSFRSQITLDATRTQPPVAGKLGRVPVLVRLHEGNFRFLDARSDGTDLRFIAEDDQTPLNYHLESFDAVTGLAYVWVDLPAVEPGRSQSIWLYYGNETATAVANAPATYDGETALVYHFNESTGAPRDHTANGNNAGVSSALPSYDSLIGQGVELTSTTQIRISSSASLTFASGEALTLSAWIRPDAPTPQPAAVLFTQLPATSGSQARLAVGLRQNRPFIQLIDATGAVQEVISRNQLQPLAWAHLAIVAAEQIRLYVNGIEMAVLKAAAPDLGGELLIGTPVVDGAQAALTQASTPAGKTESESFIGKLDELTVARVPRSPEWLSFAAATQGREASFVSFAPKPEVRGDWFGGGYFGILLAAVTVDGWVVIAILGVMLAISFAVIYGRTSYVSRVNAANGLFKTQFKDLFAEMIRRKNGGGLDAKGWPTPQAEEKLEDSSTYRIYTAGIEEVSQRAALAGSDRVFALGPQTAESLRATLDSALVREQQNLNKQMVFLTISISGGPFLGLLGTVIGVMITFASIAAAGDVNVNAIAPGVAAALMATVAGLAVAIPALFAYNYLTTRIRDITAEMQVFANELVSKMTELYAPA